MPTLKFTRYISVTDRRREGVLLGRLKIQDRKIQDQKWGTNFSLWNWN